MKRTIIYVFGPNRLKNIYNSDQPLPNDPTGWLKIGLTTTEDDSLDKWDAAMSRIRQESRTGISETSVLLDVFEYPFIQGKPDDCIRNIMSSEIYELESSKANNKLLDDKYQIKAGQEFIYGASRKNVLAAIHVYERKLLLKADNSSIDELKKMICSNAEEAQNEQDETTDAQKDLVYSAFFDNVIKAMPDGIRELCSHYKGKNYVIVKSVHKRCLYSASLSTRKNEKHVAFETLNGIDEVEKINQCIEKSGLGELMPAIMHPVQGTKDQDKYYYKIGGDYSSESEEDTIKWMVDNITTMFNYIEKFDF